MWQKQTTIAAYIRSSFNNAILPDSNGEKVVFDSAKLKNYTNEQIYQILSQIITYGISNSPSGEDAFYMDGSREGTGDIGDGTTNSQNNKNKPTYALVFGDERIKGQGLKSVSTSVYANLRYSYAWQGKRPSVFIYAEDETKYYGIALGYAGGNSGIFFAPCTIKKKYYEELGKLGEVHYQVGVDFAFNKKTDTSYIDLFSGIKRPYNGEQSKTVFGDYTTIEMFGGDLSKYESLILGIDFTCEYNDTYGTMSAYATIDFGPIGTDKSQTPNLKATTRKVWLGTYDVNNLNKIFGFWAADELWVESVQFEYKPTTTDTCKHTFSDMITREGHCTKDAVIRHKCTKCAYEYEEAKPATGHTFYDRKNSSGKVIRTCRDCGFAFLTDEPLEYECNHKYEKSIIQNVSCDTNGIFNYICKYCGESYTETITATGHKYIVTVVNPTATQKGYTLHTCEKCNDTYTDNETEALGELVNTTENVVKGIAEGDIFKVEEKIAFTPIGANSNIEPIENAQRFIASDWEITPLENWTKAEGNYSFVVYMPGDYKLKVVFKKQEYISGNWKDTTETAQLEIGFKVVEEKIPSDDEIYQPETQNPTEEATEEITNNTGDNIMKNTKSSKKTILWIGIILLITAGTSLGVYFYKKKSKLT